MSEPLTIEISNWAATTGGKRLKILEWLARELEEGRVLRRLSTGVWASYEPADAGRIENLEAIMAKDELAGGGS